VPPDFGSFRIAAKRAIVVDLKCIEASDNGIAKWWERINDCYGKLVTNGSVKEKRNQIYENYKLMDDDRLKYVSEKYDAKYAVLHNETLSSYNILFTGNKFKIVDID